MAYDVQHFIHDTMGTFLNLSIIIVLIKKTNDSNIPTAMKNLLPNFPFTT